MEASLSQTNSAPTRKTTAMGREAKPPPAVTSFNMRNAAPSSVVCFLDMGTWLRHVPSGNPPTGGGAVNPIIRSSSLLLGDGPVGRPVNCGDTVRFPGPEMCCDASPARDYASCKFPVLVCQQLRLRGRARTDPGPPSCPSVMETLSWNQPATRLPATAPGHDATSRIMHQPLLPAGWELRSGVNYYEEKLAVLSLCRRDVPTSYMAP